MSKNTCVILYIHISYIWMLLELYVHRNKMKKTFFLCTIFTQLHYVDLLRGTFGQTVYTRIYEYLMHVVGIA